VGKLHLALLLSRVSPGSTPVCLLLLSPQLPDDLLLLAPTGPGSPLPPFALTLQL
jgi:hypothetical protein